MVVEGRLETERWGSVGFHRDDPRSPGMCRKVARSLLTDLELTWIPDLVDDVEIIVSELVTNACRHGRGYPFGALTIWHPGKWLVITVHDKNPTKPWDALYRDTTPDEWEGGRGLPLVRALADQHLGEVSFAWDHNRADPGKVVRVRLLMPNVIWPWRDRVRNPWDRVRVPTLIRYPFKPDA